MMQLSMGQSESRHPSSQDCWAQWLLHRRHGGLPSSPDQLETLQRYREGVLKNARLQDGDVLLDVGAGDGLIAFGALDRVGVTGAVIFSDISQDLLDHSHQVAEELGVLNRCRFVRAPADELAAVQDASVDVVTTRSVLIYVRTKQRAFSEFHRVLRPGGRLSIFEPINRYGFPCLNGADGTSAPRAWAGGPAQGRPFGYDLAPVQELAEKVGAAFIRTVEPAATNPMLDFDERDLIAFAEAAGFVEVELELKAEIKRFKPRSWEGFLDSAPNPLAPTLREAMREALTPEETDRFLAHLRLAVEAGRGTYRHAFAYLWAIKP